MMSLFSKEKQILVNEDSKDKKLDEKKSTAVIVPVHKLMSNRKLGGQNAKGGFKGLKPIKTRLAWSATISSSSNTILNSYFD